MTTIKRGTIRSYDSAVHEASVQVAGSLAVYLPAVPVATDIPAAAVVSGRECGIVFFTDDDPADAVVVTVHGANPPASPAGTRIEDADADTSWEAEASADEDKLRGTVAGTVRTLVQNASPHFQITGDLKVSGHQGVDHTPATDDLLHVGSGSPYTKISGINVGVGLTASIGANTVEGVGGYAVSRNSGAVASYGLHFLAGTFNINLPTAAGVLASIFASGSVTLTDASTFQADPLGFGSATVTTIRQFYAKAQNRGTNRYGFVADDITGGTIARMMDLQNALEVHGTGETARASHTTQVYIWEGTTPTRRRLHIMDPGAGGANFAGGENVCILV